MELVHPDFMCQDIDDLTGMLISSIGNTEEADVKRQQKNISVRRSWIQ